MSPDRLLVPFALIVLLAASRPQPGRAQVRFFIPGSRHMIRQKEKSEMYGTVARLKIKPGTESELQQLTDEDTANLNGFLFDYVYRLDSGNDEYILVVGFESKEAYVANANSPEQHESYLRFRALMERDPEWNDGEIIHAHTQSN